MRSIIIVRRLRCRRWRSCHARLRGAPVIFGGGEGERGGEGGGELVSGGRADALELTDENHEKNKNATGKNIAPIVLTTHIAARFLFMFSKGSSSRSFSAPLPPRSELPPFPTIARGRRGSPPTRGS